MLWKDERDLCIFKDMTKPRNMERIPIICGQIRKLWIRLKRDNDAVGFGYTVNYIQSLAYEQYENGSTDPFYWEEDRWYDFIDSLVEQKRGLSNPYLTMEQLDTIAQIVKYFENYWIIYPDLRLQQIFDIFDRVVGKRIEHEVLSVDFWKNIMVPEQLGILNNSILALQDNIKRVEDEEESFLAGIGKDKYIQILQAQIFQTEQRLKSLKKEYGVE